MEEKIKLFGKEWVLKRSMTAFLLFEELRKKPISELSNSLVDTLTIFYCILKAKNKNFNYSFDEFVELLDDEIDALNNFNAYMEKESSKNKSESSKKKKVRSQM